LFYDLPFIKHWTMTYSERVVRNNIILNLSKDGFGQGIISGLVNLSQQMVSEVLKKAAFGLPMSTKCKGVACRLSDEDLKKLPAFLAKGPGCYGFEGAYWTHARVGYVIKKEFGVDYENKQVGRILRLIKWTRQKPQNKDAKQSLEKVEKWKVETLPALKKKR